MPPPPQLEELEIECTSPSILVQDLFMEKHYDSVVSRSPML